MKSSVIVSPSSHAAPKPISQPIAAVYPEEASVIAGLDSSYFRPSREVALRAKSAGVQLWCGYLATRPGVGLASPWDRGSFENARLCGAPPLAYCSGWDDPVALKQLAASWNVRLCLDCEGGGLRGDGPWVQTFLDASGAGLYGNSPVFVGRRAPFYVLAAYPGYNPAATWSPRLPRPAGPCGWQWFGSHDEFGGGCDRGWFDDWFLQGSQPAPPPPPRSYDVALIVQRQADTPDAHGLGAIYAFDFISKVYIGQPDLATWASQFNPPPYTGKQIPMPGLFLDRFEEQAAIPVNQSEPAFDLAQLEPRLQMIVGMLNGIGKAVLDGQPGVDVKALAAEIVAAIPHNANEQAIADLVITKIGEKFKTPASG